MRGRRIPELGKVGSPDFPLHKLPAAGTCCDDRAADGYGGDSILPCAHLGSLEITPSDAVDQLAVIHNQLGNIYDDASDHDRARSHYSEAIRLREARGNLYAAAQARYNLAIALRKAGSFADAREYAEAALRDYQTYGPGAANEVQETLALISAIAKAATA